MGDGKITVHFKQRNAPSISQLEKIIHEKLPNDFNQSFSLILEDHPASFATAKVTEVIWLGKKSEPNKIKMTFKQQAVSIEKGIAYLIYQNGQVTEF